MHKKENAPDKALIFGLLIVFFVVIGAMVMGFVSYSWWQERKDRLDNSLNEIEEDDLVDYDGDVYEDVNQTYVNLFDEDRVDKTGEIYIHIENPDNEDDAVVIRMKGSDVYAAERHYKNIIGTNVRPIMTTESGVKDDLIEFLDKAIGLDEALDYIFYFDSAGGLQGSSTNQRRELYKYCKLLSSYAHNRINEATYKKQREYIMNKYDLGAKND